MPVGERVDSFDTNIRNIVFGGTRIRPLRDILGSLNATLKATQEGRIVSLREIEKGIKVPLILLLTATKFSEGAAAIGTIVAVSTPLMATQFGYQVEPPPIDTARAAYLVFQHTLAAGGSHYFQTLLHQQL